MSKGRHGGEKKRTAGYVPPAINIHRASSMNALGHWHAALHLVARSGLQTLAMASLLPTVHGDIADVPQAGKGTCLPSCLQ